MHLTDFIGMKNFRLEGKPLLRAGDFCPDFDEKDIVGVVSPNLEQGVFEAGYTILAMVLDYYHMVPHPKEGNYPPYFVFVEEYDRETRSLLGSTKKSLSQSGAGWQFLDFWPETQWIALNKDLEDTLSDVARKGITRLLWPDGYLFGLARQALPLLPKLRSVLLYGGDNPSFKIHSDAAVQDIMRRTIIHMSLDDEKREQDLKSLWESRKAGNYQSFQDLSVKSFLGLLEGRK